MALVAEGFRGSHQPGLTLLWPGLEFWESSLGALIDRMLGQACVAPTGNGWCPRSSTCCLQWGGRAAASGKAGCCWEEQLSGLYLAPLAF